jgi:hypothetical protein
LLRDVPLRYPCITRDVRDGFETTNLLYIIIYIKNLYK